LSRSARPLRKRLKKEYAESLGSGSASVWMEGPWDGNGGQLGGWDIAGIKKREMGEGYCKIWCTGSCLRLGWTSGPGRFGGILAGLGNTSYLGDAELSYCYILTSLTLKPRELCLLLIR
jgi:hypothetical protein